MEENSTIDVNSFNDRLQKLQDNLLTLTNAVSNLTKQYDEKVDSAITTKVSPEEPKVDGNQAFLDWYKTV